MKYSIICAIFALVVWNVFLIQRDQNLFEAYDACVQFAQHPNCPYKK